MITGGRGFIGSHYRAAYGATLLEDASGQIDLLDKERLIGAVSANCPDAVIHLAAQSSVATSLQDPHSTYEINFIGVLNILEALEAARFTGSFVFVSSADVYGSVDEKNLPIDEGQLPKPRSPYAVSKLAAEALCYQWSQTGRFRIVIARPFNQIGPGHDRKFAIPSFAWQIAQIQKGLSNPVVETGDIDVRRDFTDVRDSVRALHLLLKHGRNGEIYNICSGKERSVRSLIEVLIELAGCEVDLKLDPGLLRPAEQRRMVGDNRKIREEVGWTPEIEFKTTMNEILNDAQKAN